MRFYPLNRRRFILTSAAGTAAIRKAGTVLKICGPAERNGHQNDKEDA